MKKVLFVAALLVAFSGVAQELKFGKISKEELQEERYAKDSSASAAYLYKFRKTYYQYTPSSGVNLVTEVHERIKIYDNDGLDYGTKTISLYKTSGSSERISALKGYTHNLVGGDIESTKLEKDNIYKSEFNRNLNQVKLSFPNVKEGSIVEYVYKITSPYYQSIDEYVFQTDIPIKKINASLKILDYFKYNIRVKGFQRLVPVKRTTHNSSLRVNEVVIAYHLQDVPALREEKFVSNIDNYRSGVQFEIVSFEIPGRTYESFAKTWDDVVETIFGSQSFGKELIKTSYYKDDIDELLSGVTDEKEKAAKILAFVKEKVKWNSYEGYGTDEGVKEAYKEGTGNIADINLMLISMLNYAGLKTLPVILSTRDNGIPLFPTLKGFNYVVAAVNINGENCLLDACEPFSTFDILPTNTLNWYGRLISPNGSSVVYNLSPKQPSKNVVTMSVELKDDGTCDGKFRQQFNNHYALEFRKLYTKGNEENFLKDLEEEYDDLEISDYSIKNLKDLDKPVIHNYNFVKAGMVEQVGQKLIFNPLFHLVEEENPFKSENREYPVDFGYPWEDIYTVMIQIPEGYQIDHLPKPAALILPNEAGSFRYNISQNGSTIYVKANIKLKSAMIAPDNYVYLKDFYTKLIEKETEKVVLSKITGDGSQSSTTGGR